MKTFCVMLYSSVLTCAAIYIHLLLQLNQAETRCIQLEAARSKTLCDITSLSEEVQILKSKDGTSGELQKRLRIIEVELNRKQHEVHMCVFTLVC